ncbi:MAG: lysophospholipid acyltransferase family protein [Nocardioides sp.]|uniref:lysophospholipid acyltransferase family protein n=1 Tax=Nocardioides sp. TaxID=35761 RepID=UPI003F08B4E7
MRVRELDHHRNWAYTVAVLIIKPVMVPLTRRRWIDRTKIPARGGCVVAINHISHADPLLSAQFVYDQGRLPHYLAKSGLFRNKLLGWFLLSAGQIPVERLTTHAVGAFDAAVEAVREGKCVVVYPEGTLTRDPDLWPMKGKSGAARIALATGCPVIPVGQWGAHELLAPYAKRPQFFPRKTIAMKVGDPVDLTDLVAVGTTPETVNRATERIMAAITTLVEDLRGERAPAERFDPRKAGVKEIGNPNQKQRRRAWRPARRSTAAQEDT